MDIVIDFDGTVVTHEFPQVGSDVGAVPVLKELVKNGHRLILFTMRSDVIDPIKNDKEHSEIIAECGNYLTDAVNWFKEREIPLYGIQRNPSQDSWTSSPKAYGQIIIDDAALGCPLTFGFPVPEKRPFVDWVKVRKWLVEMGCLPA